MTIEAACVRPTMMFALLGALCVAAVSAQGNEPGFQSGWNGRSRTPPMLWRTSFLRRGCMKSGVPGDNSSCDHTAPVGALPTAYACTECISVAASIAALTAKSWLPAGGRGQAISLADAGYATVELDEGWGYEGQGGGHDSAGNNLIDTVKFPSMAGLVAHAHAAGLEMSWSLNNVASSEWPHDQQCHETNVRGDVRNLKDLGFDGTRLSGYGRCLNNTWYAELMKESGKNFTIGNVHWGQQTTVEPIGCHRSGPKGADAASCPTLQWCPFNYYQMAADTVPTPESWYTNMQMVVPFTTPGAPLSRQGCWAWPGKLQVGSIMDPHNKTAIDMPWNRAHFAAWCIISSPLVLEIDFAGAGVTQMLEQVASILTHPGAIAVNQAWAGSPGLLLQSSDPSNPDPPDAAGFVKLVGALGPNHDMLNSSSMTIAEAELWCGKQATCEGFTFDNQRTPPVLLFKDGMGGSTNNYTGNVVNRDPKWTTYMKHEYIGASALAQQVWGKPLPGGAWAVLAINGGTGGSFAPSLPLALLNMTGPVSVIDIWADQPVPGGKVTTAFLVPTVPPRDSGFYKLVPAQ